MHVRHLSVADFRSWASADVTFEPGPTVLEHFGFTPENVAATVARVLGAA